MITKLKDSNIKPLFAVGIPTINRADLLNEALAVYKTTMPGVQFYILDNADQQITTGENIKIYISPTNLGVAASWNVLCRKIFEDYDHALLLNDDIILRADRNGVENFINTQIYDFAVAESTNSVFLFPKQTYNEIGWFDEQFYPAYYEDNDYFWRLECKKKILLKSYLLNPAIQQNSSSIAKDPSLNKGRENRKRYEKKWGGYPGRELWKAAYNMNNQTAE